MNKVFCSIDERLADPLFEVFDGGDFVLSSYKDVESTKTELQIFFPEDEKTADAMRRLADALAIVGSDAEVECTKIPDEEWKYSYRRHFTTEAIGSRLLSVPAWEYEPGMDTGGRIPLVLDPGLAFGTGKHETTRACLEFIDALAAHSGGSFLDMGCGSGILSIAASKLGFGPVAGFDIDADAVAAARDNAALNGADVEYFEFALGGGSVTLDETIEAAKGVYTDIALNMSAGGKPADNASIEAADVAVANILGPLLVAFADEIAGYSRKTLIVSGILDELYPDVLSAFGARGFREKARKTIGEWTTGLLERA